MGQDGLGDSWQGGQAQGGGLSGSVSGSLCLPPARLGCVGGMRCGHTSGSGVALVITHFLLQLRTTVTAPERGR